MYGVYRDIGGGSHYGLFELLGEEGRKEGARSHGLREELAWLGMGISFMALKAIRKPVNRDRYRDGS